jgi:hypothetical protein
MESDVFCYISNKGWRIWGLMRGSWKPQDEGDGLGSPQFDALPAGNLQPSAHYVGNAVRIVPHRWRRIK